MTKIYLICGFIGSGKTTYAKELAKKEKAFRFSPDEWMIPLYGEHMEREVFDQRLETLIELFKKSAKQLLTIDVPVIFDFGLWKKVDRDKIVAWAQSQNIPYELLYLNTPFEECCKRALQRNNSKNSESFEMTEEMLSLFWSWFEEPETSEKIQWIAN